MPSLPVSQACTCICQRRCSIRARNDTRSLERLGHPQVKRIEYEDKRQQYLAEYDFIYKFRELFAKCREDSIPDEHRQILREAFARKGTRFIQSKRSIVSELKESNYLHKSLSKIANNRHDVLDKYIQSSEVCTYLFLKEKVDGCEARKNAAIYQKLLIFRLQQYQRALQIREKFIGIKSMNYRSSLQGETLRQNLEHSMKGFLETNKEYERYRSAESIQLNAKQLIQIHRYLKLKEKGRRFRNKKFQVRLFSRA